MLQMAGKSKILKSYNGHKTELLSPKQMHLKETPQKPKHHQPYHHNTHKPPLVKALLKSL